jgi:hypothetical protein
MKCVDLYDRKVASNYGNIAISNQEITKDALACFQLYQRKGFKLLGDPTTTGVDDKLDSFLGALNNSYNSEKIQIVEKENIYPLYPEQYLSLITPTEKAGIKTFLCPLEVLPEVGKVVYWPRDNSYWLIMSYEETEKAYFKGTIEKCNFVLSWKDDNGNRYKQRVKIQGPVETKYKNENLGELVIGKANETNSIWIAKTEQTKHLKRYNHLILNGKGYEIAVINDVSDIIKINLIEGFVNPNEDTLILGEEISGGQLEVDYDICSSLDGVSNLPLAPVDFDVLLYKEGQLLTVSPDVFIEGDATYSNEVITPHSSGDLSIKVSFKSYPVEKVFQVSISEDTVGACHYEILGPDQMDMYGTAEYYLRENQDGQIIYINPSDIKVDSRDVKIASITSSDDVKATVSAKKIGKFRLYALVPGGKIEKEVEIVNPW